MELLVGKFVFIILLMFQVVTAELTGNENNGKLNGAIEADLDSFNKDSKSAICDGKSENCVSMKGKNRLQGENCNRCGIAFGDSETARVINGTAVIPEFKYPWIVSLIKKKPFACGGSLISANFVLTAAHCVLIEDSESTPGCSGRRIPKSCYITPDCIQVRLVGPQSSETLAVRTIIPHPKHGDRMGINDIALLELARPVRCSTKTLPVCLPPRDFSQIGTPLITAGYGYNTPGGIVGTEKLREGEVREIDTRYCFKPENQPEIVNKNIICAAGMESGQSSCFGDSGSALFGKFGSKFHAVGIVSRGKIPCSANHPVTYMKTYAYLSFIRQYVRDLPQA